MAEEQLKFAEGNCFDHSFHCFHIIYDLLTHGCGSALIAIRLQRYDYFSETKRISEINLVFRSLNRTVDCVEKVLTFGITQINLVFRSLNRTFAP